MKIYAVRHGETASNKNHLLMGQRVDESLNEIGIKQAEATGKSLKNMNFDIIFSSPLKRAYETAEMINKSLKTSLVIKDDLTERDYGSFSGKSWAEIENMDTDQSREVDRLQKYDYTPYRGESMENVKSRLLKFLKEIKTDYRDKQVLIVAHGGIIKLLQFLYKENEEIFTPENAKIYEFEI